MKNGERKGMGSYIILGIVVLYLILNWFVLPKMGIRT